MRVLFNGLQIGNRSGTGRYSAALLHALMAHGGVEMEAALAKSAAEDFAGLAQRYTAPGSMVARICYEHGRLPFLGPAKLLHYPANFGPAFSSRPVVVTVHDLSFFREPQWFTPGRARYYQTLARHSIPRARRIIADSECTRSDLARWLGVEPARIDVVPLAADARFTPPPQVAQEAARKRYGLPDQFMLYSGTQEPRKNIPRIVAAWSRVAGACPWDLVIAGRIGWKTGAIAEAMAAVSHPGRVHFPGYIAEADLPAVLGAAEVFVWPSLFEGFGLPPLESMACGTPVITSNTSSLPEVAGDGALCVDPEDTDAIADAMARLHDDEVLRASLGRKGLARAAEFSWSRTAALTIAAYEQTLA